MNFFRRHCRVVELSGLLPRRRLLEIPVPFSGPPLFTELNNTTLSGRKPQEKRRAGK